MFVHLVVMCQADHESNFLYQSGEQLDKTTRWRTIQSRNLIFDDGTIDVMKPILNCYKLSPSLSTSLSPNTTNLACATRHE